MSQFFLLITLTTASYSYNETEPQEEFNSNSTSNRRSFNPYRNVCGQQILKCEQVKSETWCRPNARIIGGRETYRGEWPFVVRL